MIDVKIKLLYSDSVMPKYANKGDAGVDLYAHLDCPSATIEPHSMMKIGTGIACELPDGYAGLIFARSGLSTKEGLRPKNCVGVCDSQYRNEYIVPLYNESDEPKVVYKNDRIAQLIFMETPQVNFTVVDTLSETERGLGGFGSSGR